MDGIGERLRHLATRAAFAAGMAFALVPPAQAQWAPPFGAAPPSEIVERLRAAGYVLIHPLERRETVYLADVSGGPGGRERLVIDAWSGEILQRFAERRGQFVPEGGEFSGPPPLGPPPIRDFREGNFNYGPGGPSDGMQAPPRARAKPRPAATARKAVEPKPERPAAAARTAKCRDPQSERGPAWSNGTFIPERRIRARKRNPAEARPPLRPGARRMRQRARRLPTLRLRPRRSRARRKSTTFRSTR